MKEDVRACVESRTLFFDQYFTIPAGMEGEVSAIIAEIEALGERSADAAAFEAEFNASGLSARFNGLIPRLAPKAAAPTPELKEIKKQAMKETNPAKDLGKYAAKSVADHIKYVFKSEARHQMQKTMIENDVFDDFTVTSNMIENIEELSKFKK